MTQQVRRFVYPILTRLWWEQRPANKALAQTCRQQSWRPVTPHPIALLQVRRNAGFPNVRFPSVIRLIPANRVKNKGAVRLETIAKQLSVDNVSRDSRDEPGHERVEFFRIPAVRQSMPFQCTSDLREIDGGLTVGEFGCGHPERRQEHPGENIVRSGLRHFGLDG